MDEREKEISLYDMLLYICQRWRALLIWLVVGAVVLGAYGWWKSDANVATEDTVWESVLTAEEIEEVEAGFEYWEELQELNDKQNATNQGDKILIESEWKILSDKIDVRNKLKTYIEGFTERQGNYYESLKSKRQDEGNKNNTLDSQKKINIKYFIIGAILGVIISALIIFIKYVATKNIKTIADIENCYDFQILGVFESTNDFDKKHLLSIDKKIKEIRKKNKHRLERNENIELTAVKIKLIAEKLNLKNLCLITDIESDQDLMTKITEKLNGSFKITIIKNALAKADALQDMAKMDGAVLIEQIDVSKDEDIYEECLLCSKYGVNIIGAIVLD